MLFGLYKLHKVPLEKETFQDTEATLFHNLPDNLKKCDDSYLVHTFLKSQRARHNYSSQLLLINYCTLSFIHTIVANTIVYFYCKYLTHIFLFFRTL